MGDGNGDNLRNLGRSMMEFTYDTNALDKLLRRKALVLRSMSTNNNNNKKSNNNSNSIYHLMPITIHKNKDTTTLPSITIN
jgi:hypothetical protein